MSPGRTPAAGLEALSSAHLRSWQEGPDPILERRLLQKRKLCCEQGKQNPRLNHVGAVKASAFTRERPEVPLSPEAANAHPGPEIPGAGGETTGGLIWTAVRTADDVCHLLLHPQLERGCHAGHTLKSPEDLKQDCHRAHPQRF